MKPLIICALSAVTLLAASCGLSEKEKLAIKQAQQAKDDSIRLLQVKALEDDKTIRKSAADSITTYSTLLARQQSELAQLRGTIYTANDEMTQIKAFNVGRPARDREMQIHSQEVKIQVLLVQQTNLQFAIQHSLDEIAQFKSTLAIAAK